MEQQFDLLRAVIHILQVDLAAGRQELPENDRDIS